MKIIRIYMYLVFISITIVTNDSFAQAFNDVNHTRIKLTKYENIDGNPFFTDGWLNGSIKLVNGSSYSNLLLKYNQEEDQVYFRGKDDSDIQSFVDQVKSFDLTYPLNNSTYTAHYNSGYKDISGTTSDSYFEVIADGKAQFLKKTVKTIEEHKEYSSSVVSKKLTANTKYYILDKGVNTQIKLNNKSVLATLDSPQVKEYVSKNSLNLKLESDIVKLVNYYNTL